MMTPASGPTWNAQPVTASHRWRRAWAFCVQRLQMLGTLLAMLAMTLLSACTASPEQFVQQWTAALQSGQPAQILPLVSRSSRPLVSAMLASNAQGLVPSAAIGQVQIEGWEPDPGLDAGQGFVVQVRAAGDPTGPVRDWVLVREDGALRLDLQATALRRPWGKAGRPGSMLEPPVAAPVEGGVGEATDPAEGLASPTGGDLPNNETDKGRAPAEQAPMPKALVLPPPAQ